MSQLRQLRTANPALAFHVDTYLDVYKQQNDPDVPIQRWIDLDIRREATLIHIALASGYIERTPDQVFLPLEIWSQCLALISELTT